MLRQKNYCGGCLFRASPVFCADIKSLEKRYNDNKQRFDSSIIFGCVKCKFGGIQVLVCKPFSNKLRPFPTTFWLTCPYLVRLAGEIESNGGVNELEEFMRKNNLVHEWRKYNLNHQVIRIKIINKYSRRFINKYHTKIFRSVIKSGIGGMKLTDNINIKCLHLQTASLIFWGDHPGKEWLMSKGLFGDCKRGNDEN